VHGILSAAKVVRAIKASSAFLLYKFGKMAAAKAAQNRRKKKKYSLYYTANRREKKI